MISQPVGPTVFVIAFVLLVLYLLVDAVLIAFLMSLVRSLENNVAFPQKSLTCRRQQIKK
jgi:MFS superfamily sulfate permease-like transporter